MEPIFAPMESEQHFPQLFTVSLETSEDPTTEAVKKENEILEIAEESEELETASTSVHKPASTKRKKAKDDSTSICSQQRRIKCPECLRFSAETEEKMTRHIRKVHRGENPFQCYMCDYSTYNNVRFEEHVRKHQGIKPFKCTECNYSSASRKNLKKHELKHKPDYPLRCGICGFIGQHRSALQAHMRTHPENSNATDVKNIQPKDNTTSSVFPCGNCSSKFESAEALKLHKKSKKKCLDCNSTLCSKKLLTLHVNLYHAKKGEIKSKKRQFTCQVCGWISPHKAKILLHLIHHPKQNVDEKIVDITILRKYDIME